MKKLVYATAVTAMALTASCSGKENNESTLEMPAMPLERLDSMAVELAANPRDTLPDRLREPYGVWMAMMGADTTQMRHMAESPRIAPFISETMRVFGPTDTIASALGRALLSIDGAPHRAFGIVTPFLQSVVLVGDTAVYVALNSYLGEEHPAYSGFPDYMRRLKTPSRIVPDVVEAVLMTRHPFTPDENRSGLLPRMVYEGAVIEGMMRAGAMSEAEALGYTQQQTVWADKNLAQAWQELVARKLLFDAAPATIARMIEPAPSTALLHSDSPGRMGRFIGHRIVRAYLEQHPDTPVDSLLSADFYNNPSILLESKFLSK